MEFRCRLGTPGGEIIEGVYVAESEARLRHEFEEKGLYVLGDPAGRAGGARARSSCRDRSRDLDPRVPRLQPGAGDAAESRHAAGAVARHPPPARHQPAVQVGAGRRLRAGAGGQLAVGSVRSARDAVSRRLHGVAAGGREERQPRAGHPPLRRLREGHLERSSGRRSRRWSTRPSCSRSRCVVVGDHRAAGRAGVRRVLHPVRPELPLSTPDHRVGLELCASPTSSSWCSAVVGARRRRSSRG